VTPAEKGPTTLTAALSEFTRPLLIGLSLGLSFDPVTALLGSAGAAAVGALSARRGRRGVLWLVVAVAAWVMGDGVAIAAQAGAVVRGTAPLLGAAAPGWASWLLLAVWAVTGLAVGYLIPAAVGIAVGRRVTFGTGWLAAAAVAIMVCGAFVAISGPLASTLRVVAG
jgi:hypothetical protein